MARKFVLILVLIFFQFTLAAQEELLTRQDVHQVMSEIFEQHVDKKEMTGEILKNSFKVYMDQFDPDRTYLFENEVEQFMKLQPPALKRVLEEYKHNQLLKFEELDQLIQNAIFRARQYRQETLQKPDLLFQSSSDDPNKVDLLEEDRKRPYPKTIEELKQRIKDQIVNFISGERQRYGDRVVIEDKNRTLRAYLKQMEHKENQYLYRDEQGRPLSASERENLFVMHILKALAHSLDSHTSFLNSSEAYDMKVRLEKGFQGIGVILQRKAEGIVISRLIKNGPAERSGLVKIDDRIVKINGVDVADYTLEEMVDKLRDESSKRVLLDLKRKAQGRETEISVSLEREMIAVDEGRVDTEFESFSNGIIAKITLHSFYQGENGITSEKDMREAIKALQKQGKIKGMILDLRENSGGFLNQAVKVAGLFITNGVVVISKYSNGEERFYRDMDGKVSFDGPFIILTSKATASAAEIVAQALQDYGVAIIVGDQHTYGKGTIQSQTVTDGKASSHFKVTVGKYYTVSGRTPQVRGVKADIIVPGYYSKELIGEEYLEYPIVSDNIPESFQDPLTDVDPGLKPWYVRYYMPSLQKKETTWKDFLPELQKKSGERLAVNPEFQKFLEGEWTWNPFINPEQKLPPERDFQMSEAVSILKDMINLENQGRVPQGVAQQR